jgi:Cys-rich protein (TIGR01571 family)
MTSIFCPCIIYGKTQYRLTQRADKKDPTNMLGYTAVNGSCAAFALLCGINGILAAIQHTRIRKAYSMDSQAGNVISDCLKGCCCCCCTVAQDEKEVKRREGAAKGIEVQYRAPGGMVFAAPPR